MGVINLDTAKTHLQNCKECLQKEVSKSISTNATETNSINSLQEKLKGLQEKRDGLPTGIARGNTEVEIMAIESQIREQEMEIAINSSVETFNSNNTGPNGYKIPTNPNEIDVNYWNSLNEEAQKYLHYNRNVYQPNTIIPPQESEVNEQEMKNHGVAIAHNLNGESGNKDYRGIGIRANQQIIYDTNGQLVESSENIGTYDFVAPGLFGAQGHLLVDVKPWVEWGNAPDDSTTKEDRIKALRSSFLGKVGAHYLGYRREELTIKEKAPSQLNRIGEIWKEGNNLFEEYIQSKINRIN